MVDSQRFVKNFTTGEIGLSEAVCY